MEGEGVGQSTVAVRERGSVVVVAVVVEIVLVRVVEPTRVVVEYTYVVG